MESHFRMILDSEAMLNRIKRLKALLRQEENRGHGLESLRGPLMGIKTAVQLQKKEEQSLSRQLASRAALTELSMRAGDYRVELLRI